MSWRTTWVGCDSCIRTRRSMWSASPRSTPPYVTSHSHHVPPSQTTSTGVCQTYASKLYFPSIRETMQPLCGHSNEQLSRLRRLLVDHPSRGSIGPVI